MKSNILKDDHCALIELSRSMTPQERLMAFYRHSRLLYQFAHVSKKTRKKSAQ